MAKIDRTMVQRLIQTQLDALAAGGIAAVVMPGEADPEGSARWVRLIAIDYTPIAGTKPNVAVNAGGGIDHPEYCAITLSLSVYCSPALMAQSSGALSSAISHLGVKIEHATLIDSGTTHQVDLGRMNIAIDSPAHGEQAGIASAGITIDGRVGRQSGESMLTLP